MLKRNITYDDFNDKTVTEEFYFNLSKADIVRWSVKFGDDVEAALNKIIASKDNEVILAEFEKLILASYGVKSEDGKRFERTPEITAAFRNSAAYDSLLWEMFTDPNSAANFVNGIMPKEMVEAMRQQDKPVGPPPTAKVLTSREQREMPLPPQ